MCLPFFFCASDRRQSLFCRYSYIGRCSKGFPYLFQCCSKGLSFSVRFELEDPELRSILSSKGLPFSVRFVLIGNQTGIKYICNPSRVSNCAYLFSLVFFKEKFPRSPILFSIRPVHVANFSGISPRYRNFL